MFSGKRILARAVFGKQAHGFAFVGILEAVGHHVIQHLAMPHPQASATLGQQVGRIRHALHAARHNDFRRTREQHIVREHRGLHAGTAHFGQRGRPRRPWQTGGMCRLARRCLTQTRHQAIAEQYLFDLLRIEPCALNGRTYRGAAKVNRAGRREFAQKPTNRGSGRRENHNRVVHERAPDRFELSPTIAHAAARARGKRADSG